MTKKIMVTAPSRKKRSKFLCYCTGFSRGCLPDLHITQLKFLNLLSNIQ